jgi:hypothetical protein
MENMANPPQRAPEKVRLSSSDVDEFVAFAVREIRETPGSRFMNNSAATGDEALITNS